MSQKSDSVKRIWQFDYLKAFAIIFVIILHGSWSSLQRKNPVFPYFINMAVPIFMIVSGYMNMQSCEQKKIRSIKEWFIKVFVKQSLQLFVPYLFLYVFEVYQTMHSQGVIISGPGFIKMCLLGGFGPGSYYIPVLIQLLIIFPFMYFLMKYNTKLGIVIIVLAQIIFEIIFAVFHISESIYRIMVFRYMIFVLFGMYLYEKKVIDKKYVILGIVIGLVYITFTTYGNFKMPLFYNWVSTSMPVVFWIGGIVYLLLRNLRKIPGFLGNILECIGQSTFYIFIIQKLYYVIFSDEKITSYFLKSITAVIICSFVGCLYHALYKKIVMITKRH